VPRHTLKSAVKRGALIAAANWQVTLIQASADSLFKLLLAAPVIGGVFLVALAVGSEPQSLIALGSREMMTTLRAALMSQPVVLAAFVLAVAIVGIGGSLFVFVVKAGTVSTLVRSDRETGAIEEATLHLDALSRASRFEIDSYVESARLLFPRYARLGIALMAVYVLSGALYLAIVATGALGSGWGVTALTTMAFVGWITVVNLLYLLVQIVMTADDCRVASATRRVATFLRQMPRDVLTVFLTVLALVIGATGASILATAALGLVAFVPFFGLAALPLQLLAWLLRGLVFQYLGLTSIGAYLKLYRTSGVSTAIEGHLKPAATFIH
jgi:hypothetical protein